MQPVATALQTVLENVTASDPRDLVALFEFYEPSVTPGANGFDNSLASECFAGIEITWLGQAYRRAVLDAGSITKSKGSRSNRCTLRLSNADENRYVATWVTQNQVEGMRLVVRLISRSASTTLATSTIRFSGRCEKPDGFDVIQGSIAAVEDVGGVDVEFPPRTFLAEDPEGRSPADPLNEGFPYITLNGTFTFQRPEPDKSFSRRDMRRYFATAPWSSFDDTPLGEPIPLVFGRSQIQMNRGVFVDTGRVTRCGDFACMGPIEAFLNFRMLMSPDYAQYFTQQDITYHLGEAGGTGTQTVDPLWPTHPPFSYTAWVAYNHVYIGQGAFTNIDAGQPTVATILGLICDLPDGSGVYNTEGWTDDGADIVRKILTGDRFFNIDPAFIEDSAVYATRQYNQAPVVDDSNSGLIYIPDPDIGSAGIDFVRYRATSYINARRARHVLGLEPVRPEEEPVEDFEPFDPFDPPTIPVEARRLAKRFTTNVLLKKRMKGTDFLWNVVLASFLGYLVWNWRGKIEPRSERPADFAHLRSAVSAGATTLPIEDVTPWTASDGLWGRILLGSPLTTSEARKVTSAAYTADANGITLSASASGLTATASGATLSGGNSSTKATGTVTIGSTPDAGDTVTVIINGISIVYTVESSETTATVAYMVAAHINANTQLRRFVSAVASGAVVTISSKWGVLTLTAPALANSHTGPVSNPTTAPAGLTASGSGSSLSAGDYRVAYANRNAIGSTYVTPHTTVTVTAGQQINIPALAFPAGVTSRDWFVSKGASDPEMVLHTNNTTALGFAITAVPSSTAAFPPEYNTTGEELVRVAMSFASNNQTAAILAQADLTRGNIFDGTYKWPGGRDQPTYTQVVGTYVSAKDDFYPNAKAIVRDKALWARLGKDSPKELDLQAVDNSRQAFHLARYDFAKFVDHHWFNQLGSNGLALLLEEGDLICSSDDSGGHVNVLTQVEDITFNLQSPYTVSINKARLYSTDMFLENVPKTRPLLPSVLQWTATLDTVVQLIDVPFWREADAAKGPGVMMAIRRAAGTGDWRGAFVYLDTGDGYKQVLDLDVEAVTGEALTVLADHAAGADSTSTVRVRLNNSADVLTMATDDELRAGANLFRIAREILQAKTPILVGGTDDEYDLTNLVRGLYGTENETAGHAIGDDFTVLDGKVFHLPIDAKHAGSTIRVKAATVNQDLADATEYTLAWEGRSLLPLAIARVELEDGTGLAPRDVEGNIYLGVWPRSNLQGIGDEYRYDALEDDGTAIDDAFETFREGQPMPALLIADESLGSKFANISASVSGNTFSHSGGITDRRARSLQKIRQTDNYAEAILRAGGANAGVRFGLMSAGKDWRTADFDYSFRLSLSGGSATLEAYEGATLLEDEDATGYYADGKHVRLRLLGNKVQFLVGPHDDATPPFAESAIPANYPLIVVMRINSISTGDGYVENATMTTNPLPGVIITKAQQEEWYGAVKSPMRLRIRQHSGIREVGYGFPWEDEI